jgi:hypothetical protein
MSELKLSPGWLARDVARASERVASWHVDRSSSQQDSGSEEKPQLKDAASQQEKDR